jgi:uncharacterized protein (DUF302 family)
VIVTLVTGEAGAAEKRLLEALERRGLKLFARVDHAAAAREAGLELESEVVLMFGNPRAGTPLMAADRRVGIELPLRVLIWREGAQTMIGFRDPRELAGAYALEGLEGTLEQMAALLAELVAEASA